MSSTLQAYPDCIKSEKNDFRDKLHRPLRDVRISVTEQCNFYCPHCKPNRKQKYSCASKNQLTFNEILRISKILVTIGIKKVRLTGGEPLLRVGLPKLILGLKNLGIEDLALTTNGFLLENFARLLKKNGLDRITVSLNALNQNIFQKMTGTRQSPQAILNAIKTCEQNGFKQIKINVLVKKTINEDEIIPLVKYFRGTGHILRFIEYMDVGTENHWDEKDVVSSSKILKSINHFFPVSALNKNYQGEVANRYAYEDGKGEIGFISSVSQPFCQDCHRLRLSSDGKLYNCLFSENSFDIRKHLHCDDLALSQLIQEMWKQREDKYSEIRFSSDNKKRNKIEMYKIGG